MSGENSGSISQILNSFVVQPFRTFIADSMQMSVDVDTVKTARLADFVVMQVESIVKTHATAKPGFDKTQDAATIVGALAEVRDDIKHLLDEQEHKQRQHVRGGGAKPAPPSPAEHKPRPKRALRTKSAASPASPVPQPQAVPQPLEQSVVAQEQQQHVQQQQEDAQLPPPQSPVPVVREIAPEAQVAQAVQAVHTPASIVAAVEHVHDAIATPVTDALVVVTEDTIDRGVVTHVAQLQLPPTPLAPPSTPAHQVIEATVPQQSPVVAATASAEDDGGAAVAAMQIDVVPLQQQQQQPPLPQNEPLPTPVAAPLSLQEICDRWAPVAKKTHRIKRPDDVTYVQLSRASDKWKLVGTMVGMSTQALTGFTWTCPCCPALGHIVDAVDLATQNARPVHPFFEALLGLGIPVCSACHKRVYKLAVPPHDDCPLVCRGCLQQQSDAAELQQVQRDASHTVRVCTRCYAGVQRFVELADKYEQTHKPSVDAAAAVAAPSVAAPKRARAKPAAKRASSTTRGKKAASAKRAAATVDDGDADNNDEITVEAEGTVSQAAKRPALSVAAVLDDSDTLSPLSKLLAEAAASNEHQ